MAFDFFFLCCCCLSCRYCFCHRGRACHGFQMMKMISSGELAARVEGLGSIWVRVVTVQSLEEGRTRSADISALLLRVTRTSTTPTTIVVISSRYMTGGPGTATLFVPVGCCESETRGSHWNALLRFLNLRWPSRRAISCSLRSRASVVIQNGCSLSSGSVVSECDKTQLRRTW